MNLGKLSWIPIATLIASCGGDGTEPLPQSDSAINLTAFPAADDRNPAFSADGASMVFSSVRNGGGTNLNLWRMTSSGANPTPLTAEPEADNVNLPGSCWNEATARICFSSDRTGNDEIWTIRADGSDPSQITDHPARDWEPTYSPSGTAIAFQSDRDGNWEIYRIELSSGEITRLTEDPGNDWEPNWSPLGDRIVFQSDRSSDWEIYTIAAQGGDVHRVTDDPSEDTDPSWSSDQSMIVFASDRGGESDIWVLRGSDETPIQVTRDPAYDGAPSFSPDGEWIAFESSRGGDLDIWRIDSPYAPVSWGTVNDFVYQLQNVSLDAVGATRFDLAIIDYSADGSDETRYTAPEIATLKDSPGGRKLTLAYMSIGEAEDYRWYWQPSWDANADGIPDPAAPSWLGESNPEWQGNYKVRYWDPAWQALIVGPGDTYLQRIVDAGFDGVYLDIIDAYEYWGPGGVSGENRASAEEEMVEFVLAIAACARITLAQPMFGVFPQNGEGLSRHADYVEAVTGIGQEDTWYEGNSSQPPSHTTSVIADLDVFSRAGKLVLATDYVTQHDLIDDFYAKACARGFVPYATVRDLDRLTINPGHEPD